MTSVEQIINIIFGGQVDVASVSSILVAVWGLVWSIIALVQKRKAIKDVLLMDTKDKQIEEQKKEIDQLKEAISGLGNLITDAYLSNPNVDPDTKKRLASEAEHIAQVAKLDLSDAADKLITAAQEYSPDSNLVKHAEQIKADAEIADQVLNSIEEEAQSAIEKLKI